MFTRKQFILMASSILLDACQKKNYESPLIPYFNSQKVLIIGAGVAGLHAAKTLWDMGFKNIQILEAKARWGGRIFTNYDFAEFPIELGAELVHGEFNIYKKILDKHKTPFVNANIEPYVYFENKLRTEKELEKNALFDLASQFEDNLESFNLEDIPFSQVIEKYPFGNHPDILAYLNARLGNENGTDNNTLSARVTTAYDSRNRSGETNFFLKIGVQEVLAKEYHQVIPLIKYNQVVSSIDYSQNPIRVTTTNGGSFEADRVIITVPLTILKKEQIQFIPKLPLKHQEAIQKIGMDAGMKIVIKFKRQFWPSNMESFVGAGVIPEYWPTGNGRGENLYLTGFVMGKNARYLSSLSNSQQIAEVLAQLNEIFGSGVATKNYNKHIVMDWLKEEHILGAYSFTSVGSLGAFEVLSEPVSDRIYFAGEATRSDGTHQTIHGAMLSGLDAAGKILV